MSKGNITAPAYQRGDPNKDMRLAWIGYRYVDTGAPSGSLLTMKHDGDIVPASNGDFIIGIAL